MSYDCVQLRNILEMKSLYRIILLVLNIFLKSGAVFAFAPRIFDVHSPIEVVGQTLRRNGSYNLVCFYNLEGPDGLQPETIDPHLCTHIITGFATITNNTLVDSQSHIDMYPRVMELRKKNPNLKIMLVSGGGPNSAVTTMVRCAENRANFINQSISYLTEFGFDGFDLDWEFPGWGGDPPTDKYYLVQFLKEFSEATEKHSAATGHPQLIFSIDVSASFTIIISSYDIPEIAKYVTFINIMCYDYHFYIWYDPATGHNSPLFKRSIEFSIWATMNTAWSASYFYDHGMPREKMNVGIPTYGYTYNLIDPSMHGFDAPTNGSGIYGGGMTTPRSCEFLRDGGTEVFDEESQVPYAYKDHDWISYDSVKSVTAKTTWITENGFAGMMVFALNHDDWQGTCDRYNNTVLPLVWAIHDTANLTNNR